MKEVQQWWLYVESGFSLYPDFSRVGGEGQEAPGVGQDRTCGAYGSLPLYSRRSWSIRKLWNRIFPQLCVCVGGGGGDGVAVSYPIYTIQ